MTYKLNIVMPGLTVNSKELKEIESFLNSKYVGWSFKRDEGFSISFKDKNDKQAEQTSQSLFKKFDTITYISLSHIFYSESR